MRDQLRGVEMQTEHGAPVETATAALRQLAAASSISFAIGPETSPVEAMERSVALVAMSLPTFLEGVPGAGLVCADVQAVLTELVDVTARHKAGLDLVGRAVFDGSHVTVSVGEMNRPLPPAQEEPGLYLVHRLADDVGQHAGDHGGRVTWASIRVGA
jgi:hypothetical protein